MDLTAFHGRSVEIFFELLRAQTYVSCLVYIAKDICKTNITPFNRQKLVEEETQDLSVFPTLTFDDVSLLEQLATSHL